jgi:hypothetical protein
MMKSRTTRQTKFLSFMLFLTMITLSVPAFRADAQDTIPDYINLEFETVPNILLAEIPSQKAITGNRVEGVLNVKNPLNSLYLSFYVHGSEPGLVAPSGIIAATWDNLHIIGPGAEV